MIDWLIKEKIFKFRWERDWLMEKKIVKFGFWEMDKIIGERIEEGYFICCKV